MTSCTAYPRALVATLALFGLVLASGAASGQVPLADPTAASVRAASLFVAGCVTQVGRPGRIRNWAVAQGGAEMPAEAASPYLSGHKGLTFPVGPAAEGMVLVSYDDGACALHIPNGQLATLDAALTRNVEAIQGKITTTESRRSPNGQAVEHAFSVELAGRRLAVASLQLGQPSPRVVLAAIPRHDPPAGVPPAL